MSKGSLQHPIYTSIYMFCLTQTSKNPTKTYLTLNKVINKCNMFLIMFPPLRNNASLPTLIYIMVIKNGDYQLVIPKILMQVLPVEQHSLQ